MLPQRNLPPLWLARAGEDDLVLKWIGGWVSANASSLASLGQFAANPALPASAVADFRVFASTDGVAVPADTESDSLLQRVLARSVAYERWGDAGFYRVRAVTDPEVTAACAAFDRAAAIRTAAH